jgi:hypothetical protein
MNEDNFIEILVGELTRGLTGYSISSKEPLIYKVIVNEKGEFKPKSVNLTKGDYDYRFETDILIKSGTLPLVVIETKFGGFSTHDVLTYSTKALKHKDIYPYLRYGLVVGGERIISNKFFTHNLGFDFALAIENVENAENINECIDLIKKQIKSAEFLLGVLKSKNQTRYYSSNLEVKK